MWKASFPHLLLLASDSASSLETAQGEVERRLDPEFLKALDKDCFLGRFWPLVSCIPYVIVIFTIHILIKTDLWMFVFWVFSTMSLMPCTWFALVTAPPFLMENIQFNPIQPCPTMSLHMVGNIQFTTYTVSFLVSTFLNKKYLLDFEHFHKMKTYSTLAFWTGRLDESSSSSESE